jgi:hypothetical protein
LRAEKRIRREGGEAPDGWRALLFMPRVPRTPIIIPRPEAHPCA